LFLKTQCLVKFCHVGEDLDLKLFSLYQTNQSTGQQLKEKSSFKFAGLKVTFELYLHISYDHKNTTGQILS